MARDTAPQYRAPPYYREPDWASATKVHDWRNYVSEDVRAMWDTFTDEQKAALARQADDEAGREEWD